MGERVQKTVSKFTLLFLLFSIIGWIYEVVLAFIYGYGFVNRGFLFGPYLPLYGTGALLLIISLEKLMKHRFRIGGRNVTPAVVFGAIILITTALEYAVGWFLEVVFDQRFWDYSTYNYQLHGRICLSASIRFGLGGMLFLYILFPFFTKLFAKIPVSRRFILSLCVIGVLIADLAATLYISSMYGFDPVLAQPR